MLGLDLAQVDALDRVFGGEAVTDQVLDRAHLQAVFAREHFQLRPPRHRAVGMEDLDQHAGRLEAREQREVARRFGMAGAVEHATGLRHQREDVAGLRQVGAAGIRAHRGADGVGAVVGGDAGGDAFGGFDRHVKLVPWGEVLSRTIGGRPSWRQRSRVSDRHTRPRACVTMKLMSDGRPVRPP